MDFAVKVLPWSDTEKVRLQLWDIAGKTIFNRSMNTLTRHELGVLPPGQEQVISMTRVYYRGALGCVMMFDVTSSSSFLSCRHWKRDLDNKAVLPNGRSIPCILLANKVKRHISLMND